MVKVHRVRGLSVLFFTLASVGLARADVRLPRIFTDHMVLQQEMPIAIFGTAEPGERVSASFNDQTASVATGHDGHWRVDLPAMKADGKPHALAVQGKNKIEFSDVLLGEVWLCSGQSNMGRPVDDRAIKMGDVPDIRLFNDSGETPRRDDLDDPAGWVACSPRSLAVTGDSLGPNKGRRAFSEVAFYFGLGLHEKLKVPIGLIQANCGGSTAQDWTPPPADVAAKMVYDEHLKKVTHEHGLLYWVRIRPLIPFTIRGVAWYQGEDDGRNPDYGADFTRLIESWRGAWGRDDLPFYYAQIAPTGYSGGMLGVWQGQVRVMNTVPHTGMAVSNDIYDGTTNGGFAERVDNATGWTIAGGSNPHPSGKPRIAARMADIALAKTYGEPERVVFGPMYESHKIEGDRIVVKFRYAGSGLTTRDGKPPDWFEISDGAKVRSRLKYVKAEAKITGPDTVEVWADEIKSPRCVRFGWNTLARFNLMNKEGLPAVSFRAEGAASK